MQDEDDEHLVRPSKLLQKQEELRTLDRCPKCGSMKFTKIQDRRKIISYNPLVYGYKKKCLQCSFEFD